MPKQKSSSSPDGRDDQKSPLSEGRRALSSPKTTRAKTARARTPQSTNASKGDQTGEGNNGTKKAKPSDGLRETMDSIVIAFVLAFLFRTFEAEAFVIPTGSMAPTLYGRHKDVDCEQCGFEFEVGASDELDRDNGSYYGPGRLNTAYCPNCRYENEVRNLPVYKGDRILVNKFPFEMSDPERFDVIVFKYPEQPGTNYIKRLIGLPGESIKIERGNIYARKSEEEKWNILRKQNPDKQRALQIPVYDDNHPPLGLLQHGFPERFAAMNRTGERNNGLAGWTNADNGWEADTQKRRYAISASKTQGKKAAWLRYRHMIPRDGDWDTVLRGTPELLLVEPVKPSLISDFCGYNTYTNAYSAVAEFGSFWVGDLTVSFQAYLEDVTDQSRLLIDLNEGVRNYHCTIQPSTGIATLSYFDSSLNPDDPEEVILGSQETPMKSGGNYQVTFANVDNRLCLWINNRLIDFGEAAEYKDTESKGPTDGDLTPIGIGTRHLSAEITDLQIDRDIYYRAEQLPESREYHGHDNPDRIPDGGQVLHEHRRQGMLNSKLSDPAKWRGSYDSDSRVAIFPALADDEYFVLGDNSPRSQDSRIWSNHNRRAPRRHAVPRSALVGKAFYIYWPHGVPFGNDGKGFPILYHKTVEGQHPTVNNQPDPYPSFVLPFYPQVTRMQRIR